MQTGAMGISDICLSLPTRVGKNGVHGVIAPSVTADESAALAASSAALREVWKKVA
jgi:malate/lactate dehydrogenase